MERAMSIKAILYKILEKLDELSHQQPRSFVNDVNSGRDSFVANTMEINHNYQGVDLSVHEQLLINLLRQTNKTEEILQQIEGEYLLQIREKL
jgi:hypothetical protein